MRWTKSYGISYKVFVLVKLLVRIPSLNLLYILIFDFSISIFQKFHHLENLEGIYPLDFLEIGEYTPQFHFVKVSEINGLKKRKVWKAIPKAAIPKRATVLGGRFVIAVKYLDTPNQEEKARYVIQGHRD